jgi:hypothetical protein
MTPKSIQRTCRVTGCSEQLYLGGLCRQHHEEQEEHERTRRDSLNALHFGTVDDVLPSDPLLEGDLTKLRGYWDRVCSVLQTQRGTPLMPLDEAPYAQEWCISLATEIVSAQRSINKCGKSAYEYTPSRIWVWERLHNLDAGLRSNGLPRP